MVQSSIISSIILMLLAFFIFIWYRRVLLHILQNIIAVLVYPLGKYAKYSFNVLWFLRPPLVEIESLAQLIKKSPMVTKFARYDEIAYSLESGDIVLFIGKNYNRDYVSAKWSYGSPITHIGLVVRDSHNNLSLFEATALYGVILNDLRERIESYDSDMVAIRRLKVERTQKMKEELYVLISETGGRTHDLHTLKGLIEMINSAVDIVIPFTRFELFKNRRSTLDKIFCSELIAEAYMRMGLLPDGNLAQYPCSNEYTPPDFSNFTSIKNKESELVRNLRLGASLEDELFILKEGSDKLLA